MRSILVVDDDEHVRDATAELFAQAGFRVYTAGDGVDALSELEGGKRVDIIVLDLRMPRMDGWTFRAEQRGRPAIADIPVVAMSADESSQARAIHADAFVQKPFSFPVLLEAVQTALRDRAENAHRLSLRAASERISALGRMAAGFSHEFNNPLAYVGANVRMLAEMLDRDLSTVTADDWNEGRQMASDAIDGVFRLEAISKEMGVFSRARFILAPFELNAVLHASVAMAQERLGLPSVLSLCIGATDGLIATADEFAVRDALSNIFWHELDAAAASGLQPTLRINTVAESSTLVVRVTGGAPPASSEHAARVFEPFVPTPSKATRLNLAMFVARGLLSGMGCALESAASGDGTFVITLPTGGPE